MSGVSEIDARNGLNTVLTQNQTVEFPQLKTSKPPPPDPLGERSTTENLPTIN